VKPQEIKSLTSLRFFAALHVVLFHNIHFLGTDISYLSGPIKSAIEHGDSGVSFFFILSGFILTYVYRQDDRKIRFREFMKARVSRIYPLYFLGFLLDIPRGLSYFYSKYGNFGLKKASFSGLVHLLMLQSWHPRLTPVWNFPAWSISTEMFFYLCFPFFSKLRIRASTILLCYFVPLFIFGALVFFGFDTSDSSFSVLWRSFPVLRVGEFILGIMLAKLHQTSARFKNASLYFWISNVMAISLICINIPIPHQIYSQLVLIPFFSIMIMTMASQQVKGIGILQSKVFVFLGGASYAMYILHIAIVPYLRNLLELFDLTSGLSFTLGYLGILITVSCLAYQYVEIPLQKIIRDF